MLKQARSLDVLLQSLEVKISEVFEVIDRSGVVIGIDFPDVLSRIERHRKACTLAKTSDDLVFIYDRISEELDEHALGWFDWDDLAVTATGKLPSAFRSAQSTLLRLIGHVQG